MHKNYDEQRMIERRRKYITVRRRKLQRKRRIAFTSFWIFIIVCTISLCVVLFKGTSRKNMKLLEGVWIYDEYTQYEFSENGEGCLCLENLHYEYEYTVNRDLLKLNFKDDSVRDCSYSFRIDKDKLTLIGKDGTVGGEYHLNKVK